MAKYLFQVSYTEVGLKGLLKEGGSKRAEVVAQVFRSVGGTVEAVYYAFGDTDVFIIGDMPDNVSSAAASLVASASGAVTIKTTVLMTPEEVDQAVKKSVEYRPPGK